MSNLKWLAAGDGPSESQLVGILEIVAEAQASGEGGDFDAVGGYLAVDVEGGGLPFHVAAQGEDDFQGVRFVFRDPLHQFAYRQVGRAYAVDRRDDSPEDVVETVVLACRLDAHHVADRLDHADGAAVAGAVGTDGADVGVRDHPALPAVFHIVPQRGNRLDEMVHVLLRLLEQVHRKTKGTPPAYARKSAYCFDCIFQQLGRIVPVHEMLFAGHCRNRDAVELGVDAVATA